MPPLLVLAATEFPKACYFFVSWVTPVGALLVSLVCCRESLSRSRAQSLFRLSIFLVSLCAALIKVTILLSMK
jgi:heme O synthase-like polyprenyltransferase